MGILVDSLFPSGEEGSLCGLGLAVTGRGGVDSGGTTVPSWSFIG